MNITVDLAIVAAALGVVGWAGNAIANLYKLIRQFENGLKDLRSELNMLNYRVDQLEGFNAGQGYHRRRMPQDYTGAPWLESEED